MSINSIVYLDDIFLCGETYTECKEKMNLSIKLLRNLAFSISFKKIEGPSQEIIFLGLCINSVSMTAKLPGDKVRAMLKFFKDSKVRVWRHYASYKM